MNDSSSGSESSTILKCNHCGDVIRRTEQADFFNGRPLHATCYEPHLADVLDNMVLKYGKNIAN
jgi:hypothetical protein